MAKPKARDRWNVLPHKEIEQLADNLWRVEGSLRSMPLKRVMTLARLPDGDLVIHNGIALPEALMAQIEGWGRPRYLVVPNGWHRLDAAAYLRRYPDLEVLCPRGARKQVAKVVPVTGDYQAFSPPDGSVRLEQIDGVGEAEGVMVVRSDDGTTLVFNDLIFNMPHLPGPSGLFFRYVSQGTGGPRITRIGRLIMIKDKRACRASLESLAELPGLQRIIVSHHETITAEPAAVLRRIAHSL